VWYFTIEICDYGSFLAVGDISTQKRELAGFLANISYETGGGTIGGEVQNDSLTGLYFNEGEGYIGSTAIGYIQRTGTNSLPEESGNQNKVAQMHNITVIGIIHYHNQQ